MHSIQVDKARLVAAVKSGLKQHQEELLLAREEWRSSTHEKCAALTAAVGSFDLEAGSFANDAVGLQGDRPVRIPPPPEDMSRRYERVLRMLELETRDEIQLTTEEFCQFIDNEWSWRSDWFDVNRAYTSDQPRGRRG